MKASRGVPFLCDVIGFVWAFPKARVLFVYVFNESTCRGIPQAGQRDWAAWIVARKI